MSDTFILINGIVLAVALLLLERFTVRRGRVDLLGYELAKMPCREVDGISIVFDYTSKSLMLPYSKITGRLVDKAAPTTVIELKSRSLATMPYRGRDNPNCYLEYLSFPLEPFLQSGDEDWELRLEVVTIGCYINPFYKIFPAISRLRGDIHIKQPKR
jgi:hypothetical protein